jgi:hypothetical protein
VNIEQRHVTTVNLQDGKVRDFVVYRDSRGCKLSAIARDEAVNVLLSFQDFQRLCQTLAQPGEADLTRDVTLATDEPRLPPAPADTTPTGPGWTTIRVEQRQVTTVVLHPGRARDFVLSRDDRGYKLSCVSKDEVVSLLLSPADYHKLRQQVGRWEWRDVRREPFGTEACEVAVPAVAEVAGAAGPWHNIDWLGFN